MKKLVLVLLLSPLTFAFAQKDKKDKKNEANLTYAEKAAEIQKEVWGTKLPEFQMITVPANFANESAVIFARSYNMVKSNKGKFKFMVITAASVTRSNIVTTFHERVKINDKAALEDFSSLEYQKKLDKGMNLLITNYVKKQDTYIGAKIIKPNGKEVIVNTSEEVLTKNETKDQQGKLAISDLQVGDILDYYICTIKVSEDQREDNFADNDKIFMLASEYPLLYYGIDFQFSKKIQVRYLSANGAPQFEESTNDAEDKIYSIKTRNILKYQSELWTSSYRQFPYVEMSSSYTNGFNKFMAGMSDVEFGDKDGDRIEVNLNHFKNAFNEKIHPLFEDYIKRLKKHYDGTKNLKAAPLDSSMKTLYNISRGYIFGHYSEDDAADITAINYRTAKSKNIVPTMSLALTDMKIDYDILVVCSRNTNSLDNIFNFTDFDALIRVNGDKPMYMAFDDVTTHFNEIPARYQGEKVIVLTPKRESSTRFSFTESNETLPVIGASANNTSEELKVSLLPSNMQKLMVQRLVKQTGVLRHATQKSLLPVLDIDNKLMTLSESESLKERLKDFYSTKKMKDAFDYGFADDQVKGIKKFTAEIKAIYEQEPQQVTDCKIINDALDNSNPVFQYTESFVLDNLVKKAGNNYIIDAGKLAGNFLKLEEKDRKRTLDVYMPAARSYKYTISIAIPNGYTTKGIEEFNKQKSNKTGSVTSTAAVNGNNVNITINRVYNNNFEKASAWPQLTEVIDAASEINAQKILLEKL